MSEWMYAEGAVDRAINRLRNYSANDYLHNSIEDHPVAKELDIDMVKSELERLQYENERMKLLLADLVKGGGL